MTNAFRASETLILEYAQQQLLRHKQQKTKSIMRSVHLGAACEDSVMTRAACGNIGLNLQLSKLKAV